MREFLEVLQDLWDFAFGAAGQIKNDLYSVTGSKDHIFTKLNKVGSGKSSLARVNVPVNEAGINITRVSYVKLDNLTCLNKPQLSFDNKIGLLSYGDEVTALRTEGSFTEVETSYLRGWVESNALSDDIKQVFPTLESSQVYEAFNIEAIKLRRYLSDETLAHRLKLPLHSLEYVLYVLKRAGVTVAWPPKRPREPGSWQSILRGVKGVTMGVEARTAAIFEYVGEEGQSGFLGYVKAVHPDQSITLQSVGREKIGEYRVEEFTHDEWKEWRPVFISFV